MSEKKPLIGLSLLPTGSLTAVGIETVSNRTNVEDMSDESTLLSPCVLQFEHKAAMPPLGHRKQWWQSFRGNFFHFENCRIGR